MAGNSRQSPSRSESLHGDFLGSYLHEDNRLGLTLASAEGTGVAGALAAAAFAAAAQSHRTLNQSGPAAGPHQ